MRDTKQPDKSRIITTILLSIRFRAGVLGFSKGFAAMAAGGLTAAFIDETIQLFVEGRGSSVADMWVDLAGAVIGILVSELIFRAIRSKRGN